MSNFPMVETGRRDAVSLMISHCSSRIKLLDLVTFFDCGAHDSARQFRNAFFPPNADLLYPWQLVLARLAAKKGRESASVALQLAQSVHPPRSVAVDIAMGNPVCP